MNETQEKRVYERGKRLYIDFVKRGKRVRLATGLKASAENRRFILKYFAEFAAGKKDEMLALHKDFMDAEFDKANLPKSEKARRAAAKKGDEGYFIASLLDELVAEKQTFKRFYTHQLYKVGANTLLEFCEICKIYDVREITREFCKGFLKFCVDKNYTKGTINAKFCVLYELLKSAFDKELIEKNPYFKPNFTSADLKASKELKAFNFEQVQGLIKAAQGELKSYLIIAFFTGMRKGEILGLKFSDLDFDKEIIKVQRTRLHNGTTNAPKTANSRREVLMLPPVKDELKRLKAAACGDEGFIFAKSDEFYAGKFRALCENYELRGWTLYETRHSFASIMLQKGEEALWVSKMLGHKNLAVTLQFYAAFLPDKNITRAEFLRGLDFNAEPSLFSESEAG